MIPRFLLPRTSWTASGVVGAQSRAAYSFVAMHRSQQSAAGSPREHQTWSKRETCRERRTETTPVSRALSDLLKRSVIANVAGQSRRAFSATARQQKDHHFDTLKFVQKLKDEGFSEEQAVAMMKMLSDVVEESIQNLTRTMVLREDQEKATYTQKVDFAKLRSELLTADSTESSLTRASHERLTNDLAKLNSRLRDEIQRTQASVRLDLNLEKGRIREEANSQDLKIKEVETRIEQESASLRERLEQVKFSTLQWLM